MSPLTSPLTPYFCIFLVLLSLSFHHPFNFLYFLTMTFIFPVSFCFLLSLCFCLRFLLVLPFLCLLVIFRWPLNSINLTSCVSGRVPSTPLMRLTLTLMAASFLSSRAKFRNFCSFLLIYLQPVVCWQMYIYLCFLFLVQKCNIQSLCLKKGSYSSSQCLQIFLSFLTFRPAFNSCWYHLFKCRNARFAEFLVNDCAGVRVVSFFYATCPFRMCMIMIFNNVFSSVVYRNICYFNARPNSWSDIHLRKHIRRFTFFFFLSRFHSVYPVSAKFSYSPLLHISLRNFNSLVLILSISVFNFCFSCP